MPCLVCAAPKFSMLFLPVASLISAFCSSIIPNHSIAVPSQSLVEKLKRGGEAGRSFMAGNVLSSKGEMMAAGRLYKDSVF